MNDPAESIASFLQAVAAHLPGPGKHRAAILAELEDGLLEATVSKQRSGLEHGQAVTLALQQVGDAESLAASFRPELMIARGRRTALTLLGATPIVLALWIAAARSRDPSGPSRLFDSPLDHIAAALPITAMIATGIWTIATTGRASRWLLVPPHAALLGATAMGLITVTSNLATVAILGRRLADYPGTIHTLALSAAIAASCASTILATRTSWSCVTMTKDPL